MNNRTPSDKVVQLLLDNLYPISNSINVILDNMIKISNEEVAEDQIKDVTQLLLSQIKETIPLLEHLNNEVPNKDHNDSDLEVLSNYHAAVDDILKGFRLLLDWITSEEDEGVLDQAINELFLGAKKIINLVNDIL